MILYGFLPSSVSVLGVDQFNQAQVVWFWEVLKSFVPWCVRARVTVGPGTLKHPGLLPRAYPQPRSALFRFFWIGVPCPRRNRRCDGSFTPSLCRSGCT